MAKSQSAAELFKVAAALREKAEFAVASVRDEAKRLMIAEDARKPKPTTEPGRALRRAEHAEARADADKAGARFANLKAKGRTDPRIYGRVCALAAKNSVEGRDAHFVQSLKAGFERSAPALDQAYAALVRDLDQRGMLDQTLVLLTSEFGRTPKINGTDGRDHWPKVFSILLAGGGIKRGSVYGKSNAQASEPEEDPLTVENLAATLYHLVGIPHEKKLMAPGDRPIDLVRGGRVVPELLA